MKTTILFLSFFISFYAICEDQFKYSPQIDPKYLPTADSINSLRDPGSKIKEDPDCDCDIESVQKIKPKNPIIELTLAIQEDRTIPHTASLMDCFGDKTSANFMIMEGLLNDLAAGSFANIEEYQTAIKDRASGFNEMERICFASLNASEFNRYYTQHLVRDGFGNEIGTQEVLEGYQDGRRGNPDPTTGVCIDIHKVSAQAVSPLGVNCGTMVNQWDNLDYNSAGIPTGTNGRFMHAVNVCEINGNYYMVNYSRAFKLDTPTYQTSIDAANMALANANMAGNQMTCLDGENRNFHNCNHAYLPRDSRWIVSTIGDSLDSLEEGRAPIIMETGNLGTKVTGKLTRTTKTTKDKRNTDTEVKLKTDGMMMMFNNYRWDQATFGSLGYGSKSKTTVTEDFADRPKKESTTKQYYGSYGISTPRTHTEYGTGNQQHAGLIMYINKETQHHLTDKLTLETTGELAANIGLATFYRPQENADPGFTNEGSIGLIYQLNDSTTLFGKHKSSLMTGNENNLPTLYLGQTTTGITKEFFEQNPNIDLTNTSKIHIMYGAPTMAVQNTTDLRLQLLGTVQLDGSLDAGYTFASKDFFYNEGLWAEGSIGTSVGLWEDQIRILGHFDASTGQTPQQFGEGLQIEDNPVPGLKMPGYSGGVKIIYVPWKKSK